MDTTASFGRLNQARVGVLSTIRPDGTPHLVPVVLATVDQSVVTAVDHKPKTTRRLQRLTNIRSNPRVSLLVHHYSDDWNGLWWVRADGNASVVEHGPILDAALGALASKYRQYRQRAPAGPVIVIAVDHIAHWGGSVGSDAATAPE